MRHTTVLSAIFGTSLLAAATMGYAADKKSLVFCSEGSPAGFDTAQYTTATDNDAAEPLYNRLVEFEKGETGVVPALATKWDISPDGLTYTFHLREGVKFHSNKEFKPTRDFNADDVLFTFNRMLDADHPFRKAYPTEFPYFNGMSLNKNIAKVEKTDPHTVVMTLNTVDAAFIQNIAMSFAAILSAEYAEQLLKTGKPSDINQKPIGTGPFVFQRYQKDSQIRYVANKQYWDPSKVKLDQLIFAINTDASVLMAKINWSSLTLLGSQYCLLATYRICESFWYRWNTKGPVPMGFWLMSLGLPVLSSCSAYSAERIAAKLMAMFWINAASTVFRVITTVCGSVFSTLAMFLFRLIPLKYGNSVG